jgi:hypothetical protein
MVPVWAMVTLEVVPAAAVPVLLPELVQYAKATPPPARARVAVPAATIVPVLVNFFIGGTPSLWGKW